MDQPLTPPQSEQRAPQPGTPPGGGTVEDIFADANEQPVATPQPIPKRREPAPAQLPPAVTPPAPGEINNVPPTRDTRPAQRRVGRGTRVRLIVLVVVVVLSLVALGVAYYFQNREAAPVENVPEDITEVAPVETPTRNTTPPPATPIVDSDGDGLLDTAELEAGTDPTKIDTDQDGLTDRQEIQIHKTDPLDSDTDGDSFTDGEEVRNFFNPNGPGKLLDIVDEINKFESEQAE